ncbi:MAG: bifunctional phosphoserine phosphatase/homoserine phosphotransferase ThrH [Acidimicrobiales bacterium]|nr:bifunctional phosphoserine phosphatase/homoserine phosphotransferase ThrH [Acidimicrobiales bacterium]
MSSSAVPRQRIVTLDMEGVITPEIWIAVAEATGVDALRRTTRDEPIYQKLMDERIGICKEHDITLSFIQGVIGGLRPLDGARAFLDELRRRHPVVLLSDTFEQFADPFMEQLGRPQLLCHRLHVEDDRILSFTPRIDDPKRRAVEAFQGLNYHVTAMGDSFNDIGMFDAADVASFIHAPEGLPERFPHYPVSRDYGEALAWIESAAE